MRIESKIISSWMGVFKKPGIVITADTLEELQQQYRPPKVIGSSHSYNRAALPNDGSSTVIKLGEDFDYMRYDPQEQTCTVGAATTIEDVIAFLLDHHRRLINRGNFDKQTLVGAAITGTHGYGKDATVMDSVVSMRKHEDIIIEVTLNTAPLDNHKVTMSTKRLSEIGLQAEQRFYAVLPYSGSDPVCLSVEHEVTEVEEEHENHAHAKQSTPPLSLKAWWYLDQIFPPLRRWLQKSANYINIPDRVIITGSHDTDQLYDPMKGTAGKDTWDWILWAYRPSFTCFNVALFVKPEDTEIFIKDAISTGLGMNSSLFRCMIGVRELTTKSEYEHAGNFDGPRNAVDFYCDVRNAQDLIELQRYLQRNYDTRPHLGKTVF